MIQLKFQYASFRVIPALLSQLSSISFLGFWLLDFQGKLLLLRHALLASVYEVMISVDYCDMVNASYSFQIVLYVCDCEVAMLI